MSIEDLIDAIARRDRNISLDGPDVRITTPEYRWTLRCYTNARDAYGTPLDRKMFHGATPADVLTQAMAWEFEKAQTP